MRMHLDFLNGKCARKRLAAALLLAGLAGPGLYAQSATPVSPEPAIQQGPAAKTGAAAPYVIRTGTRLVFVDVSVRNKQGQPVQGLSKDSFRLLEGGAP